MAESSYQKFDDIIFDFNTNSWSSLKLLPSPISYGKKGQIIQEQARELIARVAAFMKHDALTFQRTGKTQIPITSYKQRILTATGISDSTYRHVIKEASQVRQGALTTFSTPRSGKRNQKHGKTKADTLKQTSDNLLRIKKPAEVITRHRNAVTKVFIPEFAHGISEVAIKTEYDSEDIPEYIPTEDFTLGSYMSPTHCTFSVTDHLNIEMKTETGLDEDGTLVPKQDVPFQ